MTKKQFLFWVIAISFVHIVLVLFFGIQKQGFHEDEYYTYWSVACNDISPQNFTWHSGHEQQRRFLVKEGESFSFAMVVQNQAEDVHPPLYYITLHALMSLFTESFYKWFGILLNLAFSLVSYVGVLLIFLQVRKEYANKHVLSLVAGAIYAIAPSTISCIMLTRMYAMSTMWTILYALIFILLMNSDNYSKMKFCLLTLSGAIVCYCAFLTHYYTLFTPFFLTLFYCVVKLISRKKKKILRMLFYGISMLAAIGLAVLTYPVSINHIFKDYRGTGAINGLLGDSLFGRTGVFLIWLNDSIFAGWLVPCMIVFAACAVSGTVIVTCKKDKNERLNLRNIYLLGISCLLAFWILTKVALMVGEAASRYFYPVIALILPLMAYVVVAVILSLKETFLDAKCQVKGKVYTVITMIVALTIVSVPLIHTYSQGKVLFLYRDDREKVAFAEANKMYPLILVYNRDVDYRAWYVDNQVWPFEKIMYVESEYMSLIDDPTIAEAEKVVVYMDAPEEYLQYIIDTNPNLSTYTLVRHDPFFYIYLLE